MTYGIIFEKIAEPGFEGQYYAHIPALGLTTQGIGLAGARIAAEDLVIGWLEELRADGEPVPVNGEVLFSTLDIPENALHVA